MTRQLTTIRLDLATCADPAKLAEVLNRMQAQLQSALDAAIRAAPAFRTPAGGTQGSQLFMGVGLPSNSTGSNNDFYLRSDGKHASGNCLYHKEAGAWVALGV